MPQPFDVFSVPKPPGLGDSFEICRVLGSGAMGTVYLARDLNLGRDVALKFVQQSAEAGHLERFQREGQVSASLDHPGIVRVHSAGVANGVPYLAYELVEGARTLDQVFPELDLRGRAELVCEAARALGHAHRQGVVHRDVKPDNVLVDRAGRVRVADFGLAAAQGAERLTATGALLGSPVYMAPEVAQGAHDLVGPTVDVWALGVVLYQACTGQLPFLAGTLTELLVRIVRGKLVPPSRLNPETPTELEAICLRALRSSPQDRYPDGEALADALQAFLEGQSVEALTQRRRRALSLACLAAALTLGVGSVIFASTWEDRTYLLPPGGPVSPKDDVSPPPLDRDQLAAAKEDLLRLRMCEDPRQRAKLARSWLEAYVGHARAEEVCALEQEARLRFPVLFLEHDPNSPNAIVRGAFDCDGRPLTWTKTVAAWDLEGGGARLRQRWGPFDGGVDGFLGCSPAGFLLRTHRGAYMWCELGGGSHVLELPERHSAYHGVVSVGPDASWAAVGKGPSLFLLRLDGEQRLREPPCELPWPTEGPLTYLCAFPRGCRLLAAGDGFGHNSAIVRLIDVESGDVLEERVLPSGCSGLAVDSQGQRYAAGLQSGQIMLYTVGEPSKVVLLCAPEEATTLGLRVAHHGLVAGVAFSPDGERIYSVARYGDSVVTAGGEISVWDTRSRERLRQVPLDYLPRSLAVSPDGRLLSIGRSGGVELWLAAAE